MSDEPTGVVARASTIGVNHVGLTVRDIDASVAFYTEVAGLEFLRRGHRTGGEWFDTLTHNQGAIIDAAFVGGRGYTLQLVQYFAGGGGDGQTGHNLVGNVHLCIEVDDVDAKHAEITALGAWNPTAIVDVANGMARSFYVEDPNGIPVEFLEPTVRRD
jgi:catechol 2,3-dioxygenase-like lactoylglutathione lyase family enzyme